MKSNQEKKSWIVFLSTFPPRQCGLAVFTADLANTVNQMFGLSVEAKVVAMNNNEAVGDLPCHYPRKVIFQINQNREQDYTDAAEALNRHKEVKLVNIQHEFGIFGGRCGEHILLFLEKLQKPAVTTLHTVLPAPDEQMFNVVRSISKYSQGVVVMTNYSKEILKKDYGLDPYRIKVIPHGIHHVPFKTNQRAKFMLGLSENYILTTFGLIGPSKGIEYVIESLPAVIKKFINVRFLVAGATHPVILKQQGEKYRNLLIKKVRQLGLSDYVIFYNSYFDLRKLLGFLEAADIYISPSLNPDQAVSGTLSYALGSGRPVISTAFAQAKEVITADVGALVDFKNPMSFSEAIIKMLANDQERLQMGKNAYFRTRHMTWENVASSYVNFFAKFIPGLMTEKRIFFPIKLTHLVKLTNDFGIIQFARLSEPDVYSGYTIDDNARALIAAVRYYKKFATPASFKLMPVYVKFISRLARPDGYFDNYVSPGRIVNEQRNILEHSEDSSARTLCALAIVSVTSQIPNIYRKHARSLFENSFLKNLHFSSPRAIAFYINALYYVLSKWEKPKIMSVLKHYCDQLLFLYNKSRSPDWEWFEHYLTYSNAVLPEALMHGYKITGEKKYLEASKITMDFLIKHTFNDRMYVAIGQSGWFPKGGIRQYFDQQPEDVAATVEALNLIYLITKDKYYEKLAYKAFNWFFGDNLLGQVVYDRSTGGCYDGVGSSFINLNQGAESTISYILARLSFND